MKKQAPAKESLVGKKRTRAEITKKEPEKEVPEPRAMTYYKQRKMPEKPQ